MSDRVYDSAWQKISRADRVRQRYCSFCQAAEGEEYMDRHGRIKRVRLTVDHIDGDPRNNVERNRRVLCAQCHGSLTNRWW
jgi:hypothetical protein